MTQPAALDLLNPDSIRQFAIAQAREHRNEILARQAIDELIAASESVIASIALYSETCDCPTCEAIRRTTAAVVRVKGLIAQSKGIPA